MNTIKIQQSQTLRQALLYVAHSCSTTENYLLYGNHDLEQGDSFEILSHDCFLYEYNKYYSVTYNSDKIIKKSRLRQMWYGYEGSRSFYFNEAKLFAEFLFNYVKNNNKIGDKEQNLLGLRNHLRDILIIHKTEDDRIDIEAYLNRLYGITDSPTNENPREDEQTNNNYIVVKDRTVTEDDMLKATKIDEKCYRGYIKEGEFFSPEKCSDWNKKSGCRLYTMIKDLNNHVLGYINAVAVTDQCYKEIREGQYPDAEIDLSSIVKYTIPGEYNMYFSSIAIDEELQGDRNLFIPLFNAFLDKLITLVKEEDIVISRIVADAVTDEGKEICKGLGMEKIIETGHDKSVIYELILYPPQAHFKIISSKCKELYKLYKKRFEQLNDEED